MRQHRWAFLSSMFVLPACTGETAVSDTADAPSAPLEARAPSVGELLISQLYASGAAPAGGTDHYFSDQFIELVNAANVPLDLSGIRIANVHGMAGAFNPGSAPDSFREERPDEVVMSTVWRVPDGTELAPNNALLIAQDGANHRPFSTIDLSSASFEAYVEQSERDEDSPTVANLESVVYNGGYDWLMTVFGPSVVIVDATSELGEADGYFGPLPTVDATAVIDGIDTLMDADSEAFKRLPDAIDAGFTWHDGPYTGTALHRVRDGDAWQDTNNSTADFERGIPTPTLATGTESVFGDPWVELGTGTTQWESLDDGDTVAIVYGPQGGWHIDATLRFGGFGPGGISIAYEDVGTDAERISFVTQAELVEFNVLEADEGWVRVGDRIVLDIGDPSEVVGREAILRVTAALGDQTWSDERRVQIVDAR